MKKTLLALALAASTAAQAAGTHDGLYHCTITATDWIGRSQTYTRYFTFHTRSDDVAIMAVVSDAPNSGHGYVFGTMGGDLFSGTDNNGNAFSATMGPSFTTTQTVPEFLGNTTGHYACVKFF